MREVGSSQSFFPDVCGINLVTKKAVNYSNSPGQYDEPEGIYPDGQYTLVECDKQNHQRSGHFDLWKLKLDGSGVYERLTYFSDYPGYNFHSRMPLWSVTWATRP